MYARKEATLSSQIEGTRATFSDLIKAEAGMADEVVKVYKTKPTGLI